MDQEQQDNLDSKSMTTDPRRLALRSRLSIHFTSAGYPERHYKALEEEYKKTGMPWLYWEEPTTESLLGAAKALKEGDCMLVMIGPRGTGKTQAAVEMAMKLDAHMLNSDKEITHLYTPLGELLAGEKASWEDKMMPSPLKKAKQVGLLVLDEIQESSASDWERQQLTLLIDERYRSMKRTILIGNLNPKGLEDFLSKSVASRLRETGTIIEMTGKRYR